MGHKDEQLDLPVQRQRSVSLRQPQRGDLLEQEHLHADRSDPGRREAQRTADLGPAEPEGASGGDRPQPQPRHQRHGLVRDRPRTHPLRQQGRQGGLLELHAGGGAHQRNHPRPPRLQRQVVQEAPLHLLRQHRPEDRRLHPQRHQPLQLRPQVVQDTSGLHLPRQRRGAHLLRAAGRGAAREPGGGGEEVGAEGAAEGDREPAGGEVRRERERVGDQRGAEGEGGRRARDLRLPGLQQGEDRARGGEVHGEEAGVRDGGARRRRRRA